MVAAGLALGALTDAALALAGAATFGGPPLGLVCAPLLLLVLRPAVRAELHRPAALLVLGVAWTAAPLVDQHVLGAVSLEGLGPDLLHHTLGWVPLLVGSHLLSRPSTTVTT